MAAVDVSIDNRIAQVVLGSPPANALGIELKDGLRRALDECESGGARVIVVRSSVPGYFAAGADLKLLHGVDSTGFADYLEDLRGVIERLAALPQLSIAAIDGHALGGGLELAMACTMRMATPRSRLGVPEVKLGLLPGAGGTQRLPRLVGRGLGLDLLLSGRSVTGEEAARIGLVDALVDEQSLDADVSRLATALAEGPFDAHAAIVRCVDAARDRPLAEGMRIERDEVTQLFGTADAQEGIAAFVEKRRPTFS